MKIVRQAVFRREELPKNFQKNFTAGMILKKEYDTGQIEWEEVADPVEWVLRREYARAVN